MFKARYLIIGIAIFLFVVFIDQNNRPVPVKVLVGDPFHVQLRIIIILSTCAGVLLTIGGLLMLKKFRRK